MGETKKIRTACRSCHGGCGIIAHVEDGRLLKVEPDPNSPISEGTLCSKALAVKQLVYHPKRVTSPLKKLENRWVKVSWEEALDTVAGKFREIIEQSGPEAICIGQGTGRDYESFLYRFANLLGTPNVITAGHMCYVSRIGASLVTCGNLPVCDYDGKPALVMVWANNAPWTNPDEYKGTKLLKALQQGARLITVDPRRVYLAQKADIHLQLRPGTDAALALGMLHVIIQENLYDREFVSNFVHGWEAFKERVMEWPLDRVEGVTWVPRDKIAAAARMYSKTKPACIQWGVPIEQTLNCTDANRLLIGLMALSGNLDVPGGNVFFVPPKVRTVSDVALHKALPRQQREKMLGAQQNKLAARVALVSPKHVWDAILKGEPYRIRGMLLCGTNPVITRANSKEVYKALSQVEFLACIDFFLTPTAELGHVFLPAATWIEQDYVGDFWKRHGYVVARNKCITVGQCKQDHEIFMLLGKKMGQTQWWENMEQALDYMLEPSGLKWREFKDMGYLKGEMEYRKYINKGFSTPTGKVELYCTTFQKWGYDPLPTYREIPESPYSTPELMEKYPYILTTGQRIPVFFHSANRQIPWLREIRPEPICEIHPDTAARHGIQNGDWVWISSPRGRIKQRAKLTDILDPRVVAAEHGWWYPEMEEPHHGFDVSNINILTDNDPAHYDKPMGATNLRVLMCNIQRCSEGE